jgi:hypothetical protein
MFIAWCLLLMAAGVSHARGQERVLLGEVMPELGDDPLAAVDIAPAPAPGSSLVVRRSDVLRALAQSGVSAHGLNVPRAVTIKREVSRLSREQFAQLADASLREAIEPCELRAAHYPIEIQLGGGPRTVTAEFTNGLRSGSLAGAVVVESAGRSVRVPVMVSLVCPPPEVAFGAQLTAVAVVGHVRASAPAEARQAGRRGEIIRITNSATGANLRGRIVDAHTVEVVP